ncbi:aliphatic nitrilase [Penicillium nucicola]|uniref:aliphatic nitrilase n=1 Tax=Penicillium nucicola TaxID=1850975 RepID=UPI002544F7F7|nr:aliphatic nitrilase [Penicillium nucicola]KAJ5770825.1 aliphatic nitrilase [Penicillium nucicola]
MSIPCGSRVRVAVTQAEPVWLDLDATVDKTCTLIAEAAANGAQLVTFPECWIPGYPAWIWTRPVDQRLTTLYMQNSLKLDSPQMTQIINCAEKNRITVCISFSLNIHHSLYIAQATIGSNGKILNIRTKMKATHMERTIFGDSLGDCLDSVVETPIGRVGALSCWEHVQPLLKYNTYLQREQIHVAAWPPVFGHDDGDGLYSMSSEGTDVLARTYAIESQSFVLHTTAVLSQSGIERMNTKTGAIMNTAGGGFSAVYGPDGRRISTPLPETEEGIVYADLDLDDICKSRSFLDVCGHYSRPDLLWLGIEGGVKNHANIRGNAGYQSQSGLSRDLESGLTIPKATGAMESTTGAGHSD